MLTDERIDELAISSSNRSFVRASNRFIQEFGRAIESAACAERDARIAELERQLAELRDWIINRAMKKEQT